MERWNRAVDHLEQQLGDGPDVDVAAAARTALTSEHHFRRMFSSLAGMPVSDYVRRRRLTLATAAVVQGEGSVLDVAVRHGWGSADAFARAFRAWHGLTPTEARTPGATLRSQPRVTFTLHVGGAETMDHRITTAPALRLVGRRARLPLVHEGENTAISDFHAALPSGLDDRLLALASGSGVPGLGGLLDVSSGFDDGRADGSSFDHHHAVATTRPVDDLPDDLDVVDVPAATYVVLATTGATAGGELLRGLQELWADAYGQWFPANPYRTVPGPEILRVALSDDRTSGRGELWLPVEREP